MWPLPSAAPLDDWSQESLQLPALHCLLWTHRVPPSGARPQGHILLMERESCWAMGWEEVGQHTWYLGLQF